MITIAEHMNDVNFVTNIAKSRAEAQKENKSIYYSKPCKHGHNSYRYTANGNCSLCVSMRTQKRLAKVPKVKLRETRKSIDAKWNASEKAKKAKQNWKDRDPKWAWISSAVSGAKRRAKVKNLPFDITNEYILSIITDKCPIFDTEFKWIGSGVVNSTSATLDRIDPIKGYTEGNIVVISLKANMIKSAYSAKDLYKVADWLYEIENKG